MTVSDFIAKLSTPSSVDFEDTMAIINEHYNYQPTAFSNGTGDSKVTNDAGQNEGSCKIFAFAQLHELSQKRLFCVLVAFIRMCSIRRKAQITVIFEISSRTAGQVLNLKGLLYRLNNPAG